MIAGLITLVTFAARTFAQDEVAPEPSEEDPFELPVLGETTFSLTSTSVVQFRGNNYDVSGNRYDNDFLALTERLELAAQGEEVRASVRLDGFVPLFTEDCPKAEVARCFLEADLRPERMTVLWEAESFTLELGDSYGVIGRGAALNLRKVDILGVDTALRGAHVRGESGPFFGQLMAGLSNPQNLDPATLEVTPDPLDVIAAAELGARLGDNQEVEIAAHLVHVWFEGNDETETDADAWVWGWHVEVPALLDDRLGLYGEANALHRENAGELVVERDTRGRAVYASAHVDIDPVSFLLEWKDYRDFSLAFRNGELRPGRLYSAPPSLDRDIERYRGASNSRGGRLQIDYTIPDSTWGASIVGIAYGHSDQASEDPWDGILVLHSTIEIEHSEEGSEDPDSDNDEAQGTPWTLTATVGHRRETYLHDPFGDDLNEGDLDWSVIHGEIDGSIASGEHSFELRLEHRFEHVRGALAYRDYERGGATFTWSIADKLSITPALRWDTERPEVPKSWNTFYPSIEVRWHLSPGSALRCLSGQTPGGRLCSGGVCRDVPLFEGVLAELVLRL